MMRLHMPVSDEANTLLADDPFALLIGMVLDQQIPLEIEFSSPLELKNLLGGKLDPELIASMDPEELGKHFAKPPALHRFPVANAKRVQALAHIVVDEYDGQAENVWMRPRTGDQLFQAVHALPGFGEQKARIFIALLGKQLGVRPRGWRTTCDPFGKAGTKMSVADIVDEKSLFAVRSWKAAKKAAAKAAASEQ